MGCCRVGSGSIERVTTRNEIVKMDGSEDAGLGGSSCVWTILHQ